MIGIGEQCGIPIEVGGKPFGALGRGRRSALRAGRQTFHPRDLRRQLVAQIPQVLDRAGVCLVHRREDVDASEQPRFGFGRTEHERSTAKIADPLGAPKVAHPDPIQAGRHVGHDEGGGGHVGIPPVSAICTGPSRISV